MQHPIPVTLSEADRASLQTFIYAGKASARIFARAYALLKAADGWTDEQICEAFDISHNTEHCLRQAKKAPFPEPRHDSEEKKRARQRVEVSD